MIPLTTTLQTERLILRKPSLADFPHIFSATRYEGFNDGMPWEPPKEESELMEPFKRGIKAWECQEGFGFSIYEKNNQDFIGRISIRKEEDEIWNIGFWTHPLQQKKGYMTEAVGAILQFGFEQLNAERIEACYALWNKASEQVLKKNGMDFIEYIEKGFMKKGLWVEENLVGIRREQWDNKYKQE